METVIFARHGESEYSVQAIVNGDPSVACALTPAGVEQARELGELLAGEQLDLCVTSAFPRVRQTADVALAGRDVPRLVVEELGDPNYGTYEGAPLDEYRGWAGAHGSGEAPEGGESRRVIVTRYARAFRKLLARPERSLLVVAHSLTVAYALGAREGTAPAPRVPLAEYATPHPFTRAELERVTVVLEDWCAAPSW
ncbi:MAG: histidine phosphatase family protein [Gaiellaceae bacterium]